MCVSCVVCVCVVIYVCLCWCCCRCCCCCCCFFLFFFWGGGGVGVLLFSLSFCLFACFCLFLLVSACFCLFLLVFVLEIERKKKDVLFFDKRERKHLALSVLMAFGGVHVYDYCGRLDSPSTIGPPTP